MAPELVDLFCEEYAREANRLRRAAEACLDDMKIALAKVRREEARFIAAVRDGAPAGPLAQPMASAETEEQRLVDEICDAQEPDPVRLHPGMAQIYRRRVGDLVAALTKEDDAGMAREAIRDLIDRVVLTPDGQAKGGLRIDLEGEFARSFTPCGVCGRGRACRGCRERQNPASGRDGVWNVFGCGDRI